MLKMFFYKLYIFILITILGPSPKYFYTNSDPTTLINDALVWWATALAIIVLPVPGGPYLNEKY